MYQDGIDEGESIGANQEKINISYGINGSTEGTDGYYYIYVYMTDGDRTKEGWVNTGIQIPQDPGPSGEEGDTEEAWQNGYYAGLEWYFGNDFDAAWQFAYDLAIENGYSNATAMANAYRNGYIEGYNQ